MSWEVDDIEAVVSELKRRGVVFEEVDLPAVYGGGRTRDGIAEVENYPSTGARDSRGAWFRDMGQIHDSRCRAYCGCLLPWAGWP